MEIGKVEVPSDTVVEAIRIAEDTGAMICDLAIAIIQYGKVPSDLEQSWIVCL